MSRFQKKILLEQLEQLFVVDISQKLDQQLTACLTDFVECGT